MSIEDWTVQWERAVSASQKDMQFFVGRTNPATLYQNMVAYVDPLCPCQPGHEEWASIDKAVPGQDGKGRDCLFLQVSQPATFRVLFWWDADGVSTNDGDENAPRYDYYASIPFGYGCSWASYPVEDGEYLCRFERRRIQIVKKIATMKEAEETIRSIVSGPQEMH